MKKSLLSMLAFAAVCLCGCEQGVIRASEVEGPMVACLDRHDDYVTADDSLAPVEKSTALRSSQIVRDLLTEALHK